MDYKARKLKQSSKTAFGDVARMEPYVSRQNQRKSLDGLRFVLWSAYKNLVFWKTVTSQQNAVYRRMSRKITPAVGLLIN